MTLPDRIVADVTIEDIVQGCARCGDSCPVARLLARVTGAELVTVNSTAAWVFDEGPPVVYAHDAREFIVAFDSHEEVQPCTVTFTRKAAA